MESNFNQKENLDVAEMMKYLGIGRTSAYALLKQPDFPAAFRIGRKILVNRDRLDMWIAEKMQKGV